jgi:hypothetical protein
MMAAILALVAGRAVADDTNPWRSNWNGGSFNSPLPAYDLATAMKNASLAQNELGAATANLTATLVRARANFESSGQYVAALGESAEARQAYDDACAPVRAAVTRDPAYHALIEKRTQIDVELPLITSRSVRQSLAAQKLSFSAEANLMLADALMRDNNVQNARIRLTHAELTVADLRARFEADLYGLPEVIAAQKALETARANRDAAQAYLNGTLVARSDALSSATPPGPPPSYSNSSWGVYPYGYYGWGPFYGGGIFIGRGHHR